MNFQVSTTILNACTKKSGNLLNTPRTLMWGKQKKTVWKPMGCKESTSTKIHNKILPSDKTSAWRGTS